MLLRDWEESPDAALFTDLYALTMLQAYFHEGMDDVAVFDFFARRLPKGWNYLVVCGVADVLRYLENLTFSAEALGFLAELGSFSPDFLKYLADFRFTGNVYALPEGTVAFPLEPLVVVEAPLPQAQLVETLLINQVHFQTLMASKAARVVQAAQGSAVVDFGSRRAHGIDSAVRGARAFHVAGVAATSNVLAGKRYGIPVRGTMAHSYIQAHADELDAFRQFAALYPDTVLLVDTYDTLAGVKKIVTLARELGDAFRVRAIRLDSGDLEELARASRRILDDAGLHHVEIFASNSLDEYAISHLISRRAPIDGFGVGTRMSVSSDAPTIDCAYKLVAYGGRGRMKLSAGKSSLPSRKQVFRFQAGGTYTRDVIALADEDVPGGTPLLNPVMREGKRLPAGHSDLAAARERARQQRQALPPRLHALETADPPYPVEVSAALASERERLRAALAQQSE
ncbi:MAG: nicotinate phosphoribosyltransferase [Chloroflexi bacterium]|nr:nicotinate phosphoribosyltransferase [Chloroflexota bacterium]